MAFTIIHGRREITHGPAAKNWALAMIDLGRPVELTVRGLHSTCKCSEISDPYLKCKECKEGERVHLRILGTFAPDMKQEAFIFWGVIAEQRKHLDDNEKQRTDGDRHEIPPNTQLVYGVYVVSSGRERKCWMAPADHSFSELCVMLRNTSDLRHTFLTNEDNVAMEQARNEGRLILLPPDRLWGLIRERRLIAIPLECVETKEIDRRQIKRFDRGQICVVGAKIIAQEGSMDEFDLKDSSEWTRFFLCLKISQDSGKGTDFDLNLTFMDAWMDVHNDGHWNYIWAKLPDGQTVSYIQAGLK